MGGRGSSSSGDPRNRYKKKEDPMNVPYDEWGVPINFEPIYETVDGEKTQIGYIEDDIRYEQVEDIHPVTKKQVLDDINAWRNDDGTYGDEDTAIYLAYKDGTFVDTDDLNGKAFKKTGIVGASISTGDYEMVWGGEIGRDGTLHPWKTWSIDDTGVSNSYSGYKPVAKWRIRTRVTHNNKRENGTYYTKREIIRQSARKKVDSW